MNVNVNFKVVIAMTVTQLFLSFISAQNSANLVPNFSFDTILSCSSLSTIANAYPWQSTTTNSSSGGGALPINSCISQPCCSVPVNIYSSGFQYPRSGNGYALLFFLYENNTNRGYLQVQLKDSLKQSQCYYVSFYVNLVNTSSLKVNNIGMLLSTTAVSQGHTYAPIIANPQIVAYGNPVLNVDTLNWMKVSGIYVAQGGEKFITIGNFKNDANTDTIHTNIPGSYRFGEYNVDDVSVIPIEPDHFALKADAGQDTIISIGDSVFVGSLLGGTITTTWYNSSGQTIAANVPGLWVKPTQNTYYVLEQTFCSYVSRDTVYVSVQAMPLTLLSFNATKHDNVNVLDWETVAEVNVDYFGIERSTNGKDFESIGRVTARGGTAKGVYSYVDNNAMPSVAAFNKPVYYRLKMTDNDGRYKYSPVRMLKENNKLRLSVYPNPANTLLTIEANDLQLVQLIDYSGKTVFSKAVNGMNSEKINVSQFTKGVYRVRCTSKDGGVESASVVID